MKLTVVTQGKKRPTPQDAKLGVLYLVKPKPRNGLGDEWNRRFPSEGVLMVAKRVPVGSNQVIRFYPVVDGEHGSAEFSVGSTVADYVDLYEVRAMQVEVDA